MTTPKVNPLRARFFAANCMHVLAARHAGATFEYQPPGEYMADRWPVADVDEGPSLSASLWPNGGWVVTLPSGYTHDHPELNVACCIAMQHWNEQRRATKVLAKHG